MPRNGGTGGGSTTLPRNGSTGGGPITLHRNGGGHIAPLVDVQNMIVPKGEPLTLVEIASAGLVGPRAHTRLDATRKMVNSELFHQSVKAAAGGGFFLEKKQRGSKCDQFVASSGEVEDKDARHRS